MTTPTRLAEAFHEGEALFRAVLDNLVDGLIIIDHLGIIQAFNRAAETIFGYRESELVGKNVSVLMPEPDRSAHDGYVAKYLETGEGEIIGVGREVQGMRKDGTEFPMDLSIGEIPHHDHPFFVGIVRDVTERKEHEEVLRKTYKMEALGQLTGGVAHDFNNLLAVMMMDLEILDGMTRGREEEHELVAEAREVANAGAELTKQLLVFARNQPLVPRSADLAEVVRGLTLMLRRILGDDIDIDTAVPAGLWTAHIDSGQFENALLNLAINARDAMPTGGRLTIAMENRTVAPPQWRNQGDLATGDYVAVRVSDTGIGMAPDVLEKAFDPFFSTKGAEHGTGLGLSMVFGFAKQSGGRVEIESDVGVGTTVELLLPRADETEQETPRETGDAALPHGTESILFVEDHPHLRRRGEKTLIALGYRVQSAGNAEEALTVLAERDDIDLLFTDVVLPGGMTGPMLADAARALRPALAVLYATGYADRTQLPPDEMGRARDVLLKPYSRSELARRIRKVLDG